MSETIDNGDLGYRFYESRIYKNGARHMYARRDPDSRLEHISYNGILRAHGYDPTVSPEEYEPLGIREEDVPAEPAIEIDDKRGPVYGDASFEDEVVASAQSDPFPGIEGEPEYRDSDVVQGGVSVFDHRDPSFQISEEPVVSAHKESDVVAVEEVPEEVAVEHPRESWRNRARNRVRRLRTEIGGRIIAARNGGRHLAAEDREAHAERQRSRVKKVAIAAGALVVGAILYKYNQNHLGLDFVPWLDGDGLDLNPTNYQPDSVGRSRGNPNIPDWLENKTERDYDRLNDALREQGMGREERRQMLEHIFRRPGDFDRYMNWITDWKEAHPDMTDQEIMDAWDRYFQGLE